MSKRKISSKEIAFSIGITCCSTLFSFINDARKAYNNNWLDFIWAVFFIVLLFGISAFCFGVYKGDGNRDNSVNK